MIDFLAGLYTNVDLHRPLSLDAAYVMWTGEGLVAFVRSPAWDLDPKHGRALVIPPFPSVHTCYFRSFPSNVYGSRTASSEHPVQPARRKRSSTTRWQSWHSQGFAGPEAQLHDFVLRRAHSRVNASTQRLSLTQPQRQTECYAKQTTGTQAFQGRKEDGSKAEPGVDPGWSSPRDELLVDLPIPEGLWKPTLAKASR